MTERYTVETEPNGWSYIVYPNGYTELWRYRWEAEEYAGMLNRGELKPDVLGEQTVDLKEEK